MRKTYYLFNPGRMSRKDNTLKFTPVDEEGKEGAPIEFLYFNPVNCYFFRCYAKDLLPF